MFFFDFVPVPDPVTGSSAPARPDRKPRRTQRTKQPLTLYTQEGRFHRKQLVDHPQFGPGKVTLVLRNTVVILLDAERETALPREIRGVPVAGRIFLSACLTAKERDTANGGSFNYLRQLALKSLGIAARKVHQSLAAARHWWMARIRPYSNLGSPRWQVPQPSFRRRRIELHLPDAPLAA